MKIYFSKSGCLVDDTLNRLTTVKTKDGAWAFKWDGGNSIPVPSKDIIDAFVNNYIEAIEGKKAFMTFDETVRLKMSLLGRDEHRPMDVGIE